MRVAVDARIELFSLLFHLSGSAEFQFDLSSAYQRAVHAHFGQFAEHPAVQASARLRQSYGISHNAPMDLAVHLQPGSLVPIGPLADADEIDERWHAVPAAELDGYLADVRDFAQVSRVYTFLAEHAAYVTDVEARFADLLKVQPIDRWFESFLGALRASFTVVPGLLAGAWSYDVRAKRWPQGRERVYMVVALENPDEQGLPRPSHLTTSLVVHEMAHAYVNAAVERRLAEIEPHAAPVFELARPVMERLAYTSTKLMVEESLVRALTILYLHTKVDEAHAHETLLTEERRGFVWMARLVDALVPIAAQVGRTQQPASIDQLIDVLPAFFDEEKRILDAALQKATS